MNDQSEHIDFIPNAGEKFWYIKEVVEKGLPTLKFFCGIFDPIIHKQLVQHHNCYRTKQQAIDSL